MRTIMKSISPKECERIVSGEQTILVSKTRPKIDTPFKCYIYCTMDGVPKFIYNENLEKESIYDKHPDIINGKVIGEFVCDSMYGISNFLPYDDEPHHSILPCVLEKTCLEDYEIDEYLGNKDGYGWCISDLKIYDKPKELEEFGIPCVNINEIHCRDCKINDRTTEFCDKRIKPLNRPPQSWCYVEEL